jgi:hypothetical protein
MSETNNRNLFVVAGVAALAAVTVNVFDVALGFGTDVAAYGSRNAASWFALFAKDTFRSMYELGLLNMIYLTCMIPVFYALRSAHRGGSREVASFVLMAAIIGMAIYIANNAAIPMALLAARHAAADTDMARASYLAAAEATLAHGEDFTPASFPGMVIGGCASILAALVCFLLTALRFFKLAREGIEA